MDIDIDVDKFYDNISKVSIKNTAGFRDKLLLFTNMNVWENDMIYSSIYHKYFFEECNNILNITKRRENMPNLFLISLLLNIPVSELTNINENWDNLHLLFKKYFKWKPINFDAESYWDQVDCTCSHHIICKCFIDCLYTGISLRVGVDCFKKSGFLNPNVDEVQTKRNNLLKTKRDCEKQRKEREEADKLIAYFKTRCINIHCNNEKECNVLCKEHYDKLFICKHPLCNANAVNGLYINDYCRFHHFQKIDGSLDVKLIVDDYNKCKICYGPKLEKFGICNVCSKNYKKDLLEF